MAVDWNDPVQERGFRERASQYYSPYEIDAYINKKKGFQQEVKLYSEGKLPSDVLTAETKQKYAIEAAKTGQKIPQEGDEKMEGAKALGTAAQSVLDTIQLIEEGKLTGKAAKDALNFAAGQSYKSTFDTAGKQLTAAELAILQGTNPTVQQTKGTILQRAGGFVTGKVPPQTGEVVDDIETLKRKMNLAVEYSNAVAEGRQPNISGAVLKGQSGELPEEPPSLGGFVKNVATDVGEIVQGTAELGVTAFKGFSPGAVLVSEDERKKARKQLGEMAIALPGAIIDEYVSLFKDPLGYAYNNPVDAALAIIPLFQGVKALKAGSLTGKAGKVAKVSKVAGKVSVSEKAASGTAKVVEMINNPGSKEFIAKNVSREATQNIYKTLLDENVLNAVSPKGRIVAVQKALNSVGDDLAKAYKNSPQTYTTDRLMQGVEQVASEFPELTGVQDDVLRTMSKLGNFELGEGTIALSAEKVWDITKGLRKYGKASLDLGESGKPVAAFAERLESLLRQQLSYDLPETAPLAVKYGNLKEFYSLLDEPGALVGAGGLARLADRINGALAFTKALGEKGIQKVYNVLPEKPPEIVPPRKGAPPIPELPEVPPALGELRPGKEFASPSLVPGKSQVGETLYRTSGKQGKPQFSVKKK